MKIEEFLDLVIYGSSFGEYSTGFGVDYIAPEINKKYFGVWFSDIGIDGYV